MLATNENNVLEEFFRTGVYRPRPAEQTYATSSPSMDISRASNLDLVATRPRRRVGRPGARDGAFDLSALKPEFESRYGFVSGASITPTAWPPSVRCTDESGVLVDPHTDGVKVAREFVEPGVPMLVLETALPAKFSETIEEAWAVRRAARQSGGPGIAAAARRGHGLRRGRRAALPRGPRQDVMPDPAGPVMAACGM